MMPDKISQLDFVDFHTGLGRSVASMQTENQTYKRSKELYTRTLWLVALLAALNVSMLLFFIVGISSWQNSRMQTQDEYKLANQHHVNPFDTTDLPEE